MTLIGWTIIDRMYVLNGTVYIVSNDPSSVPPIRHITSSGYRIENGEEQVKLREPSDRDMRVISSDEAARLFGKGASRIEGVSVS